MRDGRDEVVLHAVELDEMPVLLLDELACVVGVPARVALALQQLLSLLLELTPLRDVADDARNPDHLTAVVAQRRERDLHVDKGAILPLPLHLVGVHAALLEHVVEVELEGCRIARRNDALDALAQHFFSCVAEEVLGTRVPGGDGAVQPCRDHGIAGRLDDAGQREEALVSSIDLPSELDGEEDGSRGRYQNRADHRDSLRCRVRNEPGGGDGGAGQGADGGQPRPAPQERRTKHPPVGVGTALERASPWKGYLRLLDPRLSASPLCQTGD